MKKYTQKQIKELKQNPYTFKVDEQRIFFTVEFKKIFWRKYQAGMSPRAIFKELDYSLDYFGQKQIDSIVQRIKKEAMAGEFTEGYSRNNRMKIKESEEDISPQNIKQIQNELLYLRQEVDFLKKVLKKEKEP
ncbi:MAG: HTH domain-containing protein [Clostridia bacterium]